MPSRARRLGRSLLAGLLLVPLARATGEPPLTQGERRTVTLDAADPHPTGFAVAREFAFVPAADGPFTITVQSASGDALVRVTGTADATPPENDNGYVETDALLIVTGHAGQPLQIVAGLRDAASGKLTVSLYDRAIPSPTGGLRAVTLASYWQERIDAGTPLHKPAAEVANALYLGGTALFNATSRIDDARKTFECLASFAAANHDTLGQSRARTFLAAIASLTGEPATAAGLLRAAADEAATLQTGDDADAVRSERELEMFACSTLARTLLDLGQLDETQVRLQRALDLARLLKDRGNEIKVTDQLSTLAERNHDLDGAQALVAHAIEMANELGEPGPLGDALLRQGSLFATRGQYVAAEAPLRGALQLAKSPGSQRANILGWLARAEHMLADHAAALRDYREVADIGHAIHSPRLEALGLAGVGIVQREEGLLDDAEASLSQALALLPVTGSLGSRTTIRLQLAAVVGERGDAAAELKSDEDAAADARQAKDVDAQIRALHALAIRHMAADELADALRCSTEEEALARTTSDPETLATAVSDRAYTRLRQGSPDDARKLASEADEMLRKVQVPAARLGALSTLAEAELALGNAAAARKALEESEHIYDGPDAALDPELASGLRRVGNVAKCGELAQDLAALDWAHATTDEQKRAAADEGLAAAGLWKGRALFEGLLLRSGARRDALGELVANGGGRLQPTPIAGSASRLAQSALGPGDVLVDFTEGVDRLYAWVVRDGSATLNDLGPRAPLATRVAAFVRGLSVPGQLLPLADVVGDGRALEDQLLAQALSGAAPDARLIIVPSPAVAALPFEALVVDAPSRPGSFEDVQFVIDRHEVVYAPSTPVLEHLAQAGTRSSPGRALVLGDPSYSPLPGGQQAGSARGHSASLVPLPGTRTEAFDVARWLQPSGAPPLPDSPPGNDVAQDLGPVHLCLGREAGPAALRTEPRQYGLIHCAAHALVDESDPRGTGLALSPSPGDSGFFSTVDVLALDIDANLVVLSACATSLGGVRRGEGSQSLARSFLYAGARSVVSSLWMVDDRETQRFMRTFYAGLTTGGQTTAAALRSARLELRHGRAEAGAFRGVGRGELIAPAPAPARPELAGHPFFWAPFIYDGLSSAHPLATAPARTSTPPGH